MFCSKCGMKLADNSKFCNNCGKPVNTENPNIIRMKCQDCGGVMDINEDKHIIMCPYCGSKKLLIESDAVKIEKIRSDTYKEMEYAKMQKQKDDEKTNLRLFFFFMSILFIMLIIGIVWTLI